MRQKHSSLRGDGSDLSHMHTHIASLAPWVYDDCERTQTDGWPDKELIAGITERIFKKLDWEEDKTVADVMRALIRYNAISDFRTIYSTCLAMEEISKRSPKHPKAVERIRENARNVGDAAGEVCNEIEAHRKAVIEFLIKIHPANLRNTSAPS